MIGFDEAIGLLERSAVPLPSEEVALADALGRVLARPVLAALPSPRHDVSAMDGYALRDADAAIGARFRVIGKSFAGGDLPPQVGAGEAVRIFTGAVMPQGADRVVMQENCSDSGDAMTITGEYGPGWHVRKQGSDFAAGDELLPAGRRLDPRAILALAGADQAGAAVHRAPRLAIIATGDELAPPGTARDRTNAIPESVSFGVAALAQTCGAAITGRYTGRDDLPSLQTIAARAIAAADVVVITGGASVGERDYAKAMFGDLALELLFSKVSIKPGKPIWIGRSGNCWIVGLPGNPTSAMVTARLFLVPLLAALQGRSVLAELDWQSLPIAAPLSITGQRTTFVRAELGEGGLVAPGSQDSGSQVVLARSDWLVRLDPGSGPFAAGQAVKALRF